MLVKQIKVCLIPLLLFFTLLPANTWAQVYSGSLTGVIKDPSGAVVPGAQVKLLDVGKGYSFTGQNNEEGRYLLRSIPPGTYNLFVARTGFKTAVEEGIKLDVNQNATINITLELGEQTEQVEVKGETPLLATGDAVTGQVVNRTSINDLPLIGRSVLDLAYLSPGVTPPSTCAGCLQNNFISNGGRNATADVLVDGITTTGIAIGDANVVPFYSPSVDTVEEFKIQQSNFSAEIGFSGATVINMVTRSGTNEFHGSLFEFLRNNVLTANNWFANASGTKMAPRRYNLFGGTVGGPIRKDRTFFFFNFEGLRDRRARTMTAGVPSAAMRRGDFGEICPTGFETSGRCLAPEGQLWDPYSGIYDPNEGGPVRTLFIPFNNLATYQSPGNPKLERTPYQLPAVPGNLIDPVALKIMQFFPLPSRGVGTPDYNRFNNWILASSDSTSRNQWDVKIDHNFSASDRLSAHFALVNVNERAPNCFGNALDPCSVGPGFNHPRLFGLNYTHTFSPTTLLNVTLGFTRYLQNYGGVIRDFPDVDPVQTLGFPSYIKRSGIPAFPYIYISNYVAANGGAGAIGSQGWGGGTNSARNIYHLLTSLSRIQGGHEWKIGWEGRVGRDNEVWPGTPAGLLSFEFNSTSERPWSGGGDSMASFLTGVGVPGGWGTYQIPMWRSTQHFEVAGFVQDNWRVTPNLTLTLGLRYDLETPRTERYNQMSYLDPDAPSPLKVPGFPNLRGGLRFVNSDMRTTHIIDKNNWGPRVGFAYKLRGRFVLRGGYGIFYQHAPSGTGGSTQGFEQETGWVTSYQSDGATPWGRLSDPFPGGPLEPSRGSLGLLTNVGLDVVGPLRTRNFNTTLYEQAWTFGIQRELPGSIVLDASYVGKKGTHLGFGGAGDLNSLGPEITRLSHSEVAQLFEFVPNPFFGIISSGSLSGPEVQRYQLLRPFPQFTTFGSVSLPVANSIYHAFQLRAEKRFSRGLQFLVTYTNAKSIDDASLPNPGSTWLGGSISLQDPNRRDLERSLSQFDIPQTLQFSYVYELPIGRGKSLGTHWNPVLNIILGGWKTTGIWRFSSGFPLGLTLSGGQPLPTYGAQRPNLTGTLERNTGSDFRERYFTNPEVAVNPNPFTIGNAPRVLPNLRAPGTDLANLALFKEIPLGRLREGMRLEYRAEMFNAFNHPVFCGPVTTVGDPNFGKVFSQCQGPREVQMGLKLYW